jgi:hypothetical protein
MRNTPNPGRPIDPRQATPLPSEADLEIGRATPQGKPARAQDKPLPPRNATVGDGRPTRRWSETVEAEQEQREVEKGAEK